jgi:predicted dehydrogenase
MPHYNELLWWRMDKKVAGSGALGDLGAHIIDLGRYLVGEPRCVNAMAMTFIDERPLPDGKRIGKVEVDDAFVSLFEFQNGTSPRSSAAFTVSTQGWRESINGSWINGI